MSIVIVGGNERMERQYKDICAAYGCRAKVLTKMTGSFQNKIGLFLGYPPEDVKCFIANNGKGSKCVGCWKVHCDEEKAKKVL